MNSSNLADLPKQHQPLSISISTITLAATCFLLGLFGNARVFIQLYKRPDLRRVPHYLFGNLLANGMLTMLVNMPSFVLVLTVHYLLNRRVSIKTELVAAIAGTIALAIRIVNAATLSLMAIDREDCVLRPFKRRLKEHNIRKVVIGTWIIASVLTIPFAVLISQEAYNSQTDPLSANTKRGNMLTFYLVAMGTFVNVVTFLMITISFLRVMKKLRSSSIPRSNAAQQIQHRREQQITRLTYQTCGVFLVSWLPLMMVNVLARVAEFDARVAGILRLLMVVLSNFSYAVNPFLNHRILLTTPRNQVSANPQAAG